MAAWSRKVIEAEAVCRGAAAVEIREYAPYLIAEVTIEGDNMKDALGLGFRQVGSIPCSASPCQGHEMPACMK